MKKTMVFKPDNTLRRRRTTLTEARKSKSSLLVSGTRELAGYSRGPLPNHSIRELAGSPGGPLPNASAQELDERNFEELLEELGRLTAELNHRLELQEQKAEDHGCGLTGALWGPPAVQPVSRSGPTSGFYEPQVVRPKLEQEVYGSGPSDSVSYVRTQRETPSVVRPIMEHDQQNNAYNNTGDVYSNGVTAVSDVSGMQYSARGEGQTILSPVLGQTQSNFRKERRQAEGKSMLQSVVAEQPSAVPMYRLVQVTPGVDTMESCSGIPRSSISSLKQTEERTPQDSKIEVEGGLVYHTARVKREDLRHMEEPLTEAELRSKEKNFAVSKRRFRGRRCV